MAVHCITCIQFNFMVEFYNFLKIVFQAPLFPYDWLKWCIYSNFKNMLSLNMHWVFDFFFFFFLVLFSCILGTTLWNVYVFLPPTNVSFLKCQLFAAATAATVTVITYYYEQCRTTNWMQDSRNQLSINIYSRLHNMTVFSSSFK